MICQVCGVEADTKHVSFHQNIGAFFVRFSKSIDGQLCKSCIHQQFWGMTTTTLFLGWWGMISLVLTPIFLLNNVGRYMFCLGMPPVPLGATPPELLDADAVRIAPHVAELIDRLNAGEDLQKVASSIAEAAGVTTGQVIVFVQMLIRLQSEE